MVRQDIVAGLKNAIERGYSLEQAKHSFITAGYNREEVEEASQFIHSGSALVQEKPETALQMPKPITAVQPAETVTKPVSQIRLQKEPGAFRRNFKVIILIIILMILVAILILTIVFREKIIGWFT